ncbi:hypothetical protein RFY98_00210, partial [Acinetobacter baumannii]|nr:hypothetical protein [Acinetobacter baumannii]
LILKNEDNLTFVVGEVTGLCATSSDTARISSEVKFDRNGHSRIYTYTSQKFGHGKIFLFLK